VDCMEIIAETLQQQQQQQQQQSTAGSITML
jgi:hypothetical protein